MMDAQGGRYGFLETVRQYAGERLEASGERDDVRTLHLQYYVSVAEQARARLPGADLGAWLPQQHVERENFLAAHGWCDHAADGARLGLKLSIATKFYWLYCGAAGLGYRLTLEAVRRPGVPENSPDTMQALYMLGQFCASIGRYGEAIPYLEKALAIARDRGDRRRAASVLHVAGMAAMGLGQSAVAREHLREALELATGLGNRRELAAYLIELAQLERLEGNPAAAEPLYERALALGREMRDREVSATALLDLAMIVIGQGALDRAKPMLAEAADVAIDTASEPIRQSVLDVCAALAARRGQSDRAMRFIGVSEALLQASGMQRHPADVPFVADVVAQWRASMCGAYPAPGSTSGSVAPSATVIEAREWLKTLD
jgi:tetratricopeptide (TPR) repeat protein